MEQSTARAEWEQFARPGFRIHFRYPRVTPQGRPVDRADEARGPDARVHLTAGEGSELYFEVVRFRDLAPQDEYLRHRALLEQRFGPGAPGPLTATRLGDRPAGAYGFRWDQGERTALLLAVGRDTYRIIYDPRAPLNSQILATVTVEE